MKKATIQEVWRLSASSIPNFIYLEVGISSEPNNLLYMVGQENLKAPKNIETVLKLLNSPLVEPLKRFAEYDNKKLAIFHLNRLIRTKNMLEANNEISKITFLNKEQQELLKQFMKIFHEKSVRENSINTAYKPVKKQHINWIILSLINYIHESDLSAWDKKYYKGYPKVITNRDPNKAYSRQQIYLEAQEKYANNNDLINLLNLVSEGDIELVQKVKIIEIPNEFINFILNIIEYDGNTELMKVILENIFPTEIIDTRKNALLFNAIFNKNLSLAEFFLEKGAEVNYKTPLLLLNVAAASNRKDLVNLLVKYGADPDLSDSKGNPLVVAASWGYKSIVESLLNFGCSINTEDSDGDTALISAISNKYYEVAELLILRGADTNVFNKENNTALILAAKQGNIEIVRLLLEKGANINAKDNQMCTALFYASRHGHIEIADTLLKNKAWVDIQDIEGTTALIIACGYGYYRITKLLLEHGANPNHQTHDRYSALIYAVGGKHIGIVETLLEYGANSNMQGGVETWETSLIIAACAGYIEIVKLIIKYNAEVDTQDIDGKTALHYAIDSGEEEIVKLLLKNGANMHIQTKLGISPFMLARDTNLQIFRLFLERENVLV